MSVVAFLRKRWEKNWPELHAALRGGFPSFVFSARPEEPQEIAAFWYHSVEPEDFEADLRFLTRNGYVTLTADEVLDHLEGRSRAPSRAVVLCFDDGAANLHSVVYPLLRAYSHRAVAFIAPHFHGIGPEHAAVTERPCTWDEIREMHGSGYVDFQSHTYGHRYVPRWPEPVELTGIERRFQGLDGAPESMAEDFRRARETIEARLGKTVCHLAFPRFDGNAEAVRVGLEAGYRVFWWGAHPRPIRELAGGVGLHVSRISGEFVRRLPGEGRVPLTTILRRRYGRAFRTAARQG